MFQHILVPTDFDEHASRAFEVAVSLAQKFDGKINKFLRFSRNPPTKEIVERKMMSKR